MKQKIVIIGGGLGGLFTGALLAKNDYVVTVLEKNPVIGGGLQCFERKGEVFETGIHILGGFQEGGNLNKICRYLGIMDKLCIRPTDDEAIDSITFQSDGKTYYVPRTKERFIEYFSCEFPEEKGNIEQYVNAMYSLADEVDLFYLRRGGDSFTAHSEDFSMPADEFIAKYIGNPRLRDVLAYMNPMYGGVAGHTAAFIHALINVLYIDGSSQFEGGSQQLADALAEVITCNNGRVLPGDEVVGVEILDKRIQRITTKKGKIYEADAYISDIHPCVLTRLATGEQFPKAYRQRLDEIPNSYSCFSVYIKFKPDCEPYINHPRYYQREDGVVWNLDKPSDEQWPKGFMCITPPSKNQGKWASRMIVNCIMSFDEVEQWADTKVGHRGAEYEAWKENHKQMILGKLEELCPGINSHVEYTFASSPLTIRDYYGTKRGAIYGFQADCKNIVLSIVPIYTKIKNLFLTGQNVNLHGICGVPLTAIEVAEVFEGKGNIVDKINATCAE